MRLDSPWRNLIPALAFLCVAAVLGSLVFLHRFHDEFAHLVEMENLRVARLSGRLIDVDGDLQRKVKEIAGLSESRVTVVAPDGKVLADSEKDPTSMESHADRPEVQEALRTGAGHAIRDSETLETLMVYAATRIDDADGKVRSVVRVARSDAKVDALSRSITRTSWLAAGVAILVGLLACYLFIEIRIGGTERIRRGPTR